MFIANPRDSRLSVHKLKGRLAGFSAFSVTYSIRIIFDVADNMARLYQIGDHDIYD